MHRRGGADDAWTCSTYGYPRWRCCAAADTGDTCSFGDNPAATKECGGIVWKKEGRAELDLRAFGNESLDQALDAGSDLAPMRQVRSLEAVSKSDSMRDLHVT